MQRCLGPLRRWRWERWLRSTLERQRPRVMIACEPPAIAAVIRLRKRGLLNGVVTLWHLHEHPEVTDGVGLRTAQDIVQTRAGLRLADCVVAPDAARVELLSKQVGFSFPHLIVPNCPRLLPELPAPIPSERLTPGCAGPPLRVVLYCGSVGPGRGVLAAIRSMGTWPADSGFSVVGPVSASFASQMRTEARRVGRANRLFILGAADPEQLWSIRRTADLAITVFEPVDNNSRFSAGASNKRYEAMAAGVAQVTDDNPGVSELVCGSGCGVAVSPGDCDRLGAAVADLLRNKRTRLQMGEAGRRLHLTRWNYEAQFQLLHEQIVRWIRDGYSVATA